MKKKLLSMLLVAAMAVTLLAGCGNNEDANQGNDDTEQNDDGNADDNEDGEEPSGDIVTLTFANNGAQPACQEQVTEAINEKLLADGLNIQVEFVYLEDYWNTLAMNVIGGSEYDLAWAHSSTLADLAGRQIYQPIGEALDSVGTTLKEQTPDYVLKGGTINGEIYAIPRVIPTTGFNNTFDVRKDLMEKYGIEEITTIEQLEEYFQAVLDNEEGMYPYSGSNINPMTTVYANYHFILGDGIYAMYVDPDDPNYEVKNFWASDEFVEIMNKRMEWVEKGYLQSDTSTFQDPDTGFENGVVAAVDSNVMRVSERVDGMKNTLPEAVPYTVMLEPETRYIFSAGDNMLAVPSTSKHVEEAVQLIQWFKTNQENYDLWSYGVEGVNYNLNGEAVDVSGIDSANVYSPNVWMWNDIDMARFSANYPADQLERLKTWDDNSQQSPLLGFVLDQSDISAECSQIQAVMTEYATNLLTGMVDVNDVRDDFLAALESAGIDKVIAETQEQVDAYIAAQAE